MEFYIFDLLCINAFSKERAKFLLLSRVKTGVSLYTFSALVYLLLNTLLISVDCQKYYDKYFSNHFIKNYFCSFIFYLTLKINELNSKCVLFRHLISNNSDFLKL